MTPYITITIHEQTALAALNAMAATLPISKTDIYTDFREAVQRAEQEREKAARAAVIAEHEASKGKSE